MTRIPAVALAAILAASPAGAWLAQKAPGGAATEQVLLGGLLNTASGSADTFIPANMMALPVAADDVFSVIAAAGSMTEMRARTNGTDPTGAQTWTVTLRKNGADTALACTIGSGSSGVCSSSTAVSFAAGDYASVKITPSGSPTVTRLQVAFVFQPTVANDTVISSYAGNGFSNSATQAQMAGSNNTSLNLPSTRRYPPFPDGGTIDKLYVVSNAPGAGTSYAYTIDKNGSTTTATCTIADAATACNDTANSFSVTAGDDVQTQAAPTATPVSAVAGIGFRFVPTTAGYFPLLLAYTGNDNATSTFYYALSGANAAGTATESNNQNIARAMTVTAIYVKLSAAPGSGKSKTFTLRKNGADTALTCTVSDAATTCNGTGSVAIADDDLISTSDAPSGTPAVSAVTIGYLATR